MVIEVPSNSTQDNDMGHKLQWCKTVSGLKHILLIHQSSFLATLYIRTESGWDIRIYGSAKDLVPLVGLSIEVPLTDFYGDLADQPPFKPRQIAPPGAIMPPNP